MNHTICKIKGCANEGRYCRQHLGLSIPEPRKINQVSDKQKGRLKKYSKVRAEVLRERPFCEIAIPGVCKKIATEIHHPGGRISDDDLLNKEDMKSTCRPCHEVVEKNPAYARNEGHSKSRHAGYKRKPKV